MSNDTKQPDQAAIIAEKDARIAELERDLAKAMDWLDNEPSRIGKPVKQVYPFQNGNEVYTG